ncbi:MAG: glycosyltransferase family 1 protein, partial [Bradyrhizobium sp.]
MLHDTKVFVFLGHVFGAEQWQRRWAQGEIPGMNDMLPYGYYRAAGEGWSIEYSEDVDEGAVGRLVRRALRRVAGFDLIHAWRNRRSLLS